ncbi:MAG: undecaprenyldiphospho-muramoylpentapeptide beta-N-acetylglucosaminyltransferase [Clostridia bacterium]|nr:undecaprenyldiphospho-muramoylpentapeptide beta-N-acetylglucosaminyltransferase [Clostridia bacterium]
MRILMAGGGTAGHINPALSIADTIKAKHPDAEILFVGVKGKMETTLVPAAGYPLKTVTVQGFQRRLSLKNIGRNVAAAYHAVTAGLEAARIIKDFAPDLAIGTGGYVCGPVLQKAARMGVPVLLHESNALPGVTVKMLSKYAKAVMIADDAARRHLPEGTRVVVTGNPLRRDFTAMDPQTARRELGVDDRPLVLCFGGSLGARHLNEAIAGVLKRNQKEQKLQFIVGTGRGENYQKMLALLSELGVTPDGVHVQVREYIDDMPRCMAAADLVVSRCGAMTLSELPAMKKPSVLVPSPYVAENHQFYNAMALADRGAALCIEEKDLTDARLWDTIEETALSPKTLKSMGEAAGNAAVLDAHERIYAVVKEFINTK